jgi:hypothetical protein
MPKPAVIESKGHPSPQECAKKRAVRHGLTGGEGVANSPAAAASRKGGRPAAECARPLGRAAQLGVLLDQVLAWVRTQPGTHHLRALLVFDEIYGFVPPHPANPPTKRPIVGLMKQARAIGLGVVLATQNPMDMDYRALSNAGVWCVVDAKLVRVAVD